MKTRNGRFIKLFLLLSISGIAHPNTIRPSIELHLNDFKAKYMGPRNYTNPEGLTAEYDVSQARLLSKAVMLFCYFHFFYLSLMSLASSNPITSRSHQAYTWEILYKTHLLYYLPPLVNTIHKSVLSSFKPS